MQLQLQMPEVTEIKRTPAQEIRDAISYIYAKDVKTIAKEVGVPPAVVKKEVQKLWDGNYLDEKNGFYRYQNTAEWRVYRP